jgi:hypothetical protein
VNNSIRHHSRPRRKFGGGSASRLCLRFSHRVAPGGRDRLCLATTEPVPVEAFSFMERTADLGNALDHNCFRHDDPTPGRWSSEDGRVDATAESLLSGN